LSIFFERLAHRAQKISSQLCVGLDPLLDRLPADLPIEINSILKFNQAIIDATKDFACAYKPNSAFFEQYGQVGWQILKETIAYIPEDIPVILDVKRGDIGHTAQAYARAACDELGTDAVTLSPYMGLDSLKPFLDYQDKGAFVLCLTSNQSASELQGLQIANDKKPHHLYETVAQKAASTWNYNNNCGLVVGATHTEMLSNIRKIAPGSWLLVPGIGAQGGDLAAVLKAAKSPDGQSRFLINASRSILYASGGPDFAQAAAKDAKRIKDALAK
jgi:orotidine-5'-phosphate decarboxylase